jgi:hypothetical protein
MWLPSWISVPLRSSGVRHAPPDWPRMTTVSPWIVPTTVGRFSSVPAGGVPGTGPSAGWVVPVKK